MLMLSIAENETAFELYRKLTGGAIDANSTLQDKATAEQKNAYILAHKVLTETEKTEDKIFSSKKEQLTPIIVQGTNKTLSNAFVDNILNSFNIENFGDYIHTQKKVYSTLLNEGFFTNDELNNRIDVNEATGMVIETNKSGIDETFCLENYGRLGRFKKIIKLATLREIPEAIKYGRIVDDDVKNKHGKNKTTKYAYILYDTQVDGNNITVKITIRKSLQKNKFWVHSFETIKNVSDTPADTSQGVKTGLLSTDTNGMLSQENQKVKRYEDTYEDPDFRLYGSGKLHFEGDKKKLTELQRGSLKALEAYADAIGIDIYIETNVDENINGWLDSKGIHLSLTAGWNAKGTLLFTAAHELTHFIKKYSRFMLMLVKREMALYFISMLLHKNKETPPIELTMWCAP